MSFLKVTTQNVARVLEAAGFERSQEHAFGRTDQRMRSRGFTVRAKFSLRSGRADPREGVEVRLHANMALRRPDRVDPEAVRAALAARFERVVVAGSDQVDVLGEGVP